MARELQRRLLATGSAPAGAPGTAPAAAPGADWQFESSGDTAAFAELARKLLAQVPAEARPDDRARRDFAGT